MNLIYQALYLKDSHILTVRQVSATEIYTCLTSVQLRDSLFLMVYVPLQTLSTPALIYITQEIVTKICEATQAFLAIRYSHSF